MVSRKRNGFLRLLNRFVRMFVAGVFCVPNVVKRGKRAKSSQVPDSDGNINLVFVSHLVYAKCYSEYIESRKRNGWCGALKSAPFVFLVEKRKGS